MQYWHTPFPILNLSVVPCLILLLLDLHTGFSGDRWLVWYSLLFKNFPQFVVIHTVKGFSIVNEAEVDVFSGILLLFYDPVNVDNLISGSSTFSKSSLNIWKFLAHILLKPSLENFEHYLYEKRPHSVRHIWVSVFISLLICCIALGKLLKCSEHRLPLL